LAASDQTKHNLANDLILNTILFADDQVLVARTEDGLQKAAYALNQWYSTWVRVPPGVREDILGVLKIKKTHALLNDKHIN
jgi:hypothetical protein